MDTRAQWAAVDFWTYQSHKRMNMNKGLRKRVREQTWTVQVQTIQFFLFILYGTLYKPTVRIIFAKPLGKSDLFRKQTYKIRRDKNHGVIGIFLENLSFKDLTFWSSPSLVYFTHAFCSPIYVIVIRRRVLEHDETVRRDKTEILCSEKKRRDRKEVSIRNDALN